MVNHCCIPLTCCLTPISVDQPTLVVCCVKEEHLLFIPPSGSLYGVFFPMEVFFQMSASQNQPLVTLQKAPGESLLKGKSSQLWSFLSVSTIVPQKCQLYLRKRVDVSFIVVNKLSGNSVLPWKRVNCAVSMNQITMARALLLVASLYAPVFTSKPSSTAKYTQQTANSFTSCLIGFFGINCTNLIALSQYLIVLSSITIFLPAVQALHIPFINLTRMCCTLDKGSYLVSNLSAGLLFHLLLLVKWM